VALSCVRAHPLYGRSALPLLPTILDLTDRAVRDPAAASRKCNALLQTRFGAAVIAPVAVARAPAVQSAAGAAAAAAVAALVSEPAAGAAATRGTKRQR
jgi:hypothetical protein